MAHLIGSYSFQAKSQAIDTQVPLVFEDGPLKIHSKIQPVTDGSLTVFVFGVITRSLKERDRDIPNPHQLVFEYFRKYGEMFYQHLDGLFKIIVYDQSHRSLLICNNRYQASTLYYGQESHGLVFSDSLEEILKDRDCEIHKGSVRSFLSNGFTITDQTQATGFKKLLPSFAIAARGESFRLLNHWDQEFQFERKPFDDLQMHLDRYEELYRNVIDRFTCSYKSQELGTLLSGGHDTSFAMIEGRQVWEKPIHAYTSTFPGWAFDEAKYAENICHKNGGVFHGIPFEPKDLDLMVSLIRANHEPVVGSSLPLHICAQNAAQTVDTMMAGDGGDTLWGEYYPVGEFHRYLRHLPIFMRRLFHRLIQISMRMSDWERLWEAEHVMSLFADRDCYNGFMRKLCTYRHFRDDYQKKLLNRDFLDGAEIPKSVYEVQFSKDNFQDALIEGKLFNAFYTYQSFHTTKSMDHFGLKFFLPTIDQELMRFITNLPYNYVNGGNTFHRLTNNKTINRRFHKLALARYLKREEIYNRSFDIPWYKILKPRPHLLELLQKRLKKRGFFVDAELDRLFAEFSNQKAKEYELLELKHHGYRIFTLLSLEIWLTEYFDKRWTESPDQAINLEDYLAST